MWSDIKDIGRLFVKYGPVYYVMLLGFLTILVFVFSGFSFETARTFFVGFLKGTWTFICLYPWFFGKVAEADPMLRIIYMFCFMYIHMWLIPGIVNVLNHFAAYCNEDDAINIEESGDYLDRPLPGTGGTIGDMFRHMSNNAQSAWRSGTFR